MSSESPLATLLAQLDALGDLQASRGPRHPTTPDPALSSEVARFLEDYPFLHRDPGYVEFLESYAGALLTDVKGSAVELPGTAYTIALSDVAFFGFTPDLTMPINASDEDDVPIVDEDGFLVFAGLGVEIHQVDPASPAPNAPHSRALYADKVIAYNVTGQRPWGVYAQTLGPMELESLEHWTVPEFRLCWSTFHDFLADLITGDALLSSTAVAPDPNAER